MLMTSLYLSQLVHGFLSCERVQNLAWDSIVIWKIADIYHNDQLFEEYV